jgi:hypothetical protein
MPVNASKETLKKGACEGEEGEGFFLRDAAAFFARESS